ncbi:peptide/nickel transport system substrate-binding protein [Kytococcus aerolatus]|uniref:Peptide/nickel transport system substrate-binding protein n=1 Tax=Kytococcus aerolatus TaxID=592308 RepID=A0A212SZY7_9MICO|nr:ABC transporter substrate-binding protein [Kytococcus aerolatus]SNC59180.1 peptide/nickel transport system substrate-binding protein [Kytococcus aerolatus]
MRLTKFAALAAAGSLTLAACGGGSPAEKESEAEKPESGAGKESGSGGESGSGEEGGTEKKESSAGMVADAKGPAPEVEGATEGGTLTILSAAAPEHFDPSAQYYQDVNAIMNLTNRRLTQYRVEPDGSSVLVPDLAKDLGKESKDGLTWTFELKDGLKYEDGSPITAEDVVYGIKRSFATEELPGGPAFQMEYLKGGDKYKGPFKDKGEFAGAKAVDDKTIEIHLSKPWPSLPYFAGFTQMGPIPQDKDTQKKYGNKPVASGPYKFEGDYKKGRSLTLVKNENWDPKTDPARHQYPDKIDFKFAQDFVAINKQVEASNGPDASALIYDGVDASVAESFKGENKDRIANTQGPCVSYVNMNTEKIPLEVRKAIAAAYPIDQIRTATGATEFDYEPAISYMTDTVPGFEPEPTEGLTGEGKGDPAKAKKMLQDAGKEGFELSWYYSVDNPVAVKGNQVRKQALEQAGFTVKDQGVPRAEMRELMAQPEPKVNMMTGPAGWCYDWPVGDAVYPPIFDSAIQKSGHSVGMLADKELDKEMDRIKELPAEEQGPEWAKFDKKLREEHLPAIPTDYTKSAAIFGTKVHNVNLDPNSGMPDLAGVYVEK